MDYISTKLYDKADSILDNYLDRPHTDDEDFLLNFVKVFNGYEKN